MTSSDPRYLPLKRKAEALETALDEARAREARVRALPSKWREEVRRDREKPAPEWNAGTVRLNDADDIDAALGEGV